MISLLVLKQHVEVTREQLDVLRSLGPVIPAGAPAEVAAQSPQPVAGGRLDHVEWVRQHARDYGLDPAAVLAIADVEGAGGGIGDGGLAYGPWQDHMTHFPDRPWYGYGRNNQFVQDWAWSEAGFDYVMRSMVAAGAGGHTGLDAVRAIATYYERPADIPGEIADATPRYAYWSQRV